VRLPEQLPEPITAGSTKRAAFVASWKVRRSIWMGGLVSVLVFGLGSLYGVPAAVSSPDYGAAQPGGTQSARLVSDSVTAAPTTTTTSSTSTTTTTSSTTTTTTSTTTPTTTPTPPPTTAAAVTAAPVVTTAPALAPVAPALPAYGQATTWGCPAALAYLLAYAAPGFALDCPGYALGHEAMTCLHGTPQYPDACPSGPTIAISDACPQAYMNEAANSWNLTGQLSIEQQKFGVSYATIDPFGACP
jgi:hypothetical protein